MCAGGHGRARTGCPGSSLQMEGSRSGLVIPLHHLKVEIARCHPHPSHRAPSTAASVQGRGLWKGSPLSTGCAGEHPCLPTGSAAAAGPQDPVRPGQVQGERDGTGVGGGPDRSGRGAAGAQRKFWGDWGDGGGRRDVLAQWSSVATGPQQGIDPCCPHSRRVPEISTYPPPCP